MALLRLFRFAGYFTEPRLTDAEIHAMLGRTRRRRAAGRRSAPLTVVSWNIERGVQFQKIVATLRRWLQTSCCFQEVDRYCRAAATATSRAISRTTLGMNWVSAGEFQEIGEAPAPGGDHRPGDPEPRPIAEATIVFSDQAMLRWRFNPMQPRRGGRLALRARTAGLLVYNIHLGSTEATRCASVRCTR